MELVARYSCEDRPKRFVRAPAFGAQAGIFFGALPELRAWPKLRKYPHSSPPISVARVLPIAAEHVASCAGSRGFFASTRSLRRVQPL